MATRTEIEFIDDLDGSPASESVRFAIDGVDYVIDLNDKNAEQLRETLGAYVQPARRLRRDGSSAALRSARRRQQSDGWDPKAVRLWASEEGIELATHGRIPAEIRQQYQTAIG